MARYPSITDYNVSKGIEEVYYYANEVTDSWMSNMILIAVYVIILMGVYNYKKDFPEAMAISGLIVFLISVLFWLGNFVSTPTILITLAVAALGFIFLWFEKR